MIYLMKRTSISKGIGAQRLWALIWLAVLLPSIAFAQTFPDKPIRLIVPYSSGASVDTVARMIAFRMSEELGKQVIVENKVGAGGTVGAAEAARSTPDGYTLLFQVLATAVLNQHLYKKLPYDPVGDFQPVAHIAQVPNVLVVNSEVPAKDLQEFIAYLKANPGKFDYGSAGNGTLLHLVAELFKKTSGTAINHIPYKGSAPALQDLVAGRLVMMFDNIPAPMAMIKANRLRALGVTSATRVPALPNVPTISEAGLPEFKNTSWFAIYTRAGVPPAVLAKLEAAALKAINHPETIARLKELGTMPAPMGAAELGRFWKSEIEYWRPIVKDASLTLD